MTASSLLELATWIFLSGSTTGEDPRLQDVEPQHAAVVAAHALDVELHRRAIDVLEVGRERADSTWGDARLADEAVALWRPGERAPAYYELAVLGPDDAPRGYMVLSTDEHDAPIVEAAYDGDAPTAELRASAGESIERFYRLYTTVVAVDRRGRLVGQRGEFPEKMLGYDASWLELSAEARAGSTRWSDDEGLVEQPSAVGAGLRFEPWSSWSALLAQYSENRAPLFERDRRAAADAWTAERQLRDNGELLLHGEFRELPLLPRGSARTTVRGDGADHVNVVFAERSFEQDTVLRVFVGDVPATGVFEVDIDVRYADGAAETLRLNVSRSLPTDTLGMPARDVLSAPARGVSVTTVITPTSMGSGINCSKVALRLPGGDWLSSNGQQLRSLAPYPQDNELFGVVHFAPTEIALRAPNGKWVRAVGGGGGDARADADQPNAETRFTTFLADDKRSGFIGLRAPNRRHVLRPHGSTVDARTSNPRASRFKPELCQPRRQQAMWAGTSFDDAWTKTRKYSQIPANTEPNNRECSSGCGATVWAMLFGFHDYEASLEIPKWRNYKGLYRRDGSVDGPDEVAPEAFWIAKDTPHPGIANVMSEIMKHIGWGSSNCAGGQRWTAPGAMGNAGGYLEKRVKQAKLISDYDGAMLFTHGGKVKARDVISSGQPVALGMQDPHHYPLGIGWESMFYRAWDRAARKWHVERLRQYFVVHMGHAQRAATWIPYDSWFQGWLAVPEPLQPTPPATATSPSKPKTLQPKADLPPGTFDPKPGTGPLGPIGPIGPLNLND
jgi:hypothetical protein